MERPKRTTPKIFDPAFMTYSLEVSGEVLHPLNLKVEDLAAMKTTEVRDLPMVCGSGRDEGFIESYRGVRLTDILQRADVLMREHESPSHLYVTITSSDDHWTLFSYQELFNTSIGERAIIIIERNGEPLGEKEGRIAFVSANDDKSGPRKLRYVSRVQVHEHHWTRNEA